MTDALRSSAAHPDATPTVPDTLVGRVMRTFELLAAEPMSAAELARRLDVNRSTALRLLAELMETGYVDRDARSKEFTTVPAKFLALVSQQDDHADWSQIIDPILDDIRNQTGDATILGVPASHSMVYLAYYPTYHMLAVSEQLGAVRPMHCSALGKAYLSALNPDEMEEELSHLSYVGGTERAAHGPDELRRRVIQAREDGYALDLDETFEDVRCVSVPLHIRGSLIGAVGISGPATRFAVSRMRELGKYLSKRLESL